MKTESEINFKDIVLYVLKYILIAILVGSIVGAYLCVKNYSEIRKTNDVLDITKKINASENDYQYENRVLNVTRARTYVKMIDYVNKQIDFHRDYIANSLYIQIDPDNVYQINAQLSIDFNTKDSYGIDHALFSAYERDIRTGEYLKDYANELGIKLDYVRELVSISSYDPADTIICFDNNQVDQMGSLYVSVYGPSSEFCSDVMRLILDEIDTVQKDLNSTIAPHSISLVSYQELVKSDNGIREGQINYTSRIEALQAQLVGYNNAIDIIAKELGLPSKDVIIDYFDHHEEVVVDGVPTEFSEQIINGHKDFKALAGQFGIGFGIGAGAIVVLLVICYLCSRKVKTQAQFYGIFPYITKIGVMKPSVKNAYSKLINKCSEDDTKLSSENTNKLISTNYSNLTKDYQKVLITGIGDKSAMEKAVKELNIKGDFKPDMFSNPEVLDLVPNYDCVVLLEQRKKSLYRDIKNEIRLISNAGTKIVGAILI